MPLGAPTTSARWRPCSVRKETATPASAQAPKQEGAAKDVAEADDAAEIEQRQAQADFLFDLDNDGLAFLTEISALGGDVESVEEAAHRTRSRGSINCAKWCEALWVTA